MDMTKREFLEAIVGLSVEGKIDNDLGAFANEEIQKMDDALAKRRAKAIEKDQENAALRQKIWEDILKEDEAITATVVGEMTEISTQKASAQLRKLVDEGRAVQTEVKIPKKGAQKAYTKIV